jgi:hypothetical protein
MIGERWHRYSNTLLVSLNNRVSVRDESSGSGALPKPPQHHLPVTVPPSRRPSDVLPAELEKFPHAFEGGMTSGKDGARGRVISENCDDASFPRLLFINPTYIIDIASSFGVSLAGHDTVG